MARSKLALPRKLGGSPGFACAQAWTCGNGVALNSRSGLSSGGAGAPLRRAGKSSKTIRASIIARRSVNI